MGRQAGRLFIPSSWQSGGQCIPAALQKGSGPKDGRKEAEKNEEKVGRKLGKEACGEREENGDADDIAALNVSWP